MAGDAPAFSNLYGLLVLSIQAVQRCVAEEVNQLGWESPGVGYKAQRSDRTAYILLPLDVSGVDYHFCIPWKRAGTEALAIVFLAFV